MASDHTFKMQTTTLARSSQTRPTTQPLSSEASAESHVISAILVMTRCCVPAAPVAYRLGRQGGAAGSPCSVTYSCSEGPPWPCCRPCQSVVLPHPLLEPGVRALGDGSKFRQCGPRPSNAVQLTNVRAVQWDEMQGSMVWWV